ncbi:MAG TPA: thiamine pyrophosphate-binding protein, partial [Burkholderiales bacterium]|nr:thiamine pyrophosphate-binding protein [Burkholderiales bacterium]
MKLRGADVLARTLAAAGTRHVFTLSGNHVMPVFDAALEANLNLVHVRHEAAAVHMADAWGRLTGEPGIALVTGGPGHANALGALYTALMSDSPMVLISGHAPLAELGKGAFQELPQAQLAAPLTKLSFTAQSAASLGRDVLRALETARKGRPGPVHLSVPTDVLDTQVDAEIPTLSFTEELPDLPREMLEALRQAKRPLVITGRLSAAEFEAVSGVPVVSMQSPRGLADATLGRVANLLAQADAVLLAGKRLDYTLKYGRAFDPTAKVMQLETPRGLAHAAKGLDWAKSGWLREVKGALAYRPPEWARLALSGAAAHPAPLCRALQPLLEAPDAILICDGGEYGQWAQACLSAPRRLTNGQAGAIGSALPFAAAAKLAFPDAPVLAMLGDGTF